MANLISSLIDRVIDSDFHDPFQVLGLHFVGKKQENALVRTFQPHAESVQIIIGDQKQYMYKMRREGLFEIVLNDFTEPFPYRFEIKFYDNTVHTIADPYSFLPQLGDMDRYLFNSGTHYKISF
jgi:1,4-alpha-glucan branching enzyme